MNKLTVTLVFCVALILSCSNSPKGSKDVSGSSTDTTKEVITDEAASNLDTLSQFVFGSSENLDDDQPRGESFESYAVWSDFYGQFEKKSQTFVVDCNKDTVLTCIEGTTIRIRPNTFVSEGSGKLISGKVRVTVSEYYKLSDILLANLTTTSDSLLLETGGMIHIAASTSSNEKCEINAEKRIEIGIPTSSKMKDMKLFAGDQLDDRINWNLESTVDLNEIYDFVDVLPQYPGGEQDLWNTISSNTVYPNRAKELGIQGTVLVRFIVDRDGSIRDANVIRGIDDECDRAALNALLMLDKFVPAQLNREFVKHAVTLPIKFTLANDSKANENLKDYFEKNYTDSNINKASSQNISNYLFSTSKLGWINCDRFFKYESERVDFEVDIAKYSEASVSIVFHDMKSVVSPFDINGSSKFINLPKGKKITIVAVKFIQNKPYLAIKETVTSNKKEANLNFVPVTMETLKQEMQKLNKWG